MKVKISLLIAIISAFSVLVFAVGCGNSAASSQGEAEVGNPNVTATPEKAKAVAQKIDSKLDKLFDDE